MATCREMPDLRITRAMIDRELIGKCKAANMELRQYVGRAVGQ
jgi:hypothetical protein